MKIIKLNITLLLILIVFSCCSLFLPQHPPKYRIQNYCDYVADYQIITAGSDTVRYDSVQNNTSSDFVNINVGQVAVAVVVHGNSNIFADSFIAKADRQYNIVMHDGEVFGYHTIDLSIEDLPNP